MKHRLFSNPSSLSFFLLLGCLAALLLACQDDAPATPAPTAEMAATAEVATTAVSDPLPTEEPASEPAEPVVETENVEEATAVSATDTLPLIDSFESGQLPSGADGFATIGYITWSDGSPISIEPITVDAGDELARPDQADSNTILQVNTDVGAGGWAGFSHAFANETADQWLSQDWEAYAGLSLWVYGTGSGGTFFVDILDNRNPDPSGDDAERWTYDITDDFTGWQYLEIPFEAFRRKDIGNGAPNDGLSFNDIHGYAFGVFGTIDMSDAPVYVDDVAVYGTAPDRPVEIKFNKTIYNPREGGRATVIVGLNKPASDTVTVQISTIEGQAQPDQDFLLLENTLTFAPGETNQSFTIEAIDDDLPEETEQVLLVLSQPTGAILNVQSRAILTIRDDDPQELDLLDDFNTPPPFIVPDGAALDLVQVMPNSDLTLPNQSATDTVLQITAVSPTTLTRTYSTPQDWQDKNGLGFWYYGTASGRPVTLTLHSNRTTPTADLAPDDWQLIWSDEFNTAAGTSPNPGIWQPEIGDGFLNGISGWGNGELEYYTDNPDNVAMDGEGNLVITAVQHDPATASYRCWYGSCEYTSARLITWGNVEFQYGRIEARLKLPEGQGIWPAFWMLGTDLDEVGWPQSGEIDIMENIGREPSTTHGTVHGPGYSGGQGIGAGYDLPGGTVADDFHIYAIEWTPDQIRWFVDEDNFFTITADDIPAGSEWVYNHPFFIILNLAVGGNWPGLPDDSSTFPQTMHIDYVRVYGAPETAERYQATFTDDFFGWNYISLPFNTFTRSAVQPEGAAETSLNLGEIWGYSLNLPHSGLFYLDKLQFE